MYSLSLKCGERLTAFKRISHFPGHLNFAALCPVETGEDGQGPSLCSVSASRTEAPCGGRSGRRGGAGKTCLSHPGSGLSDESVPSVIIVQEADFLLSHLMTLLDMMCRSER